ncbi:MAG: SHOCT domain-containing protein [Microthrixaceae bacterium]|nr:SHOCT domain-containing protein [Acidimicrobiales bacterium]MCB9403820.1 SHOCT domain-containing protein [Microthrixaceae bacterium]
MGLLKTAARAGVASSVHGRVQRRQQQRWAAQDQMAAQAQPQVVAVPVQAMAPPPPPPPAAAPVDTNEKLDQLRQLGELRDAGILTEAEFDAKKALILGS